MDYNFLKIKTYDCRKHCDNGANDMYMLSFSERKHIKVSAVAKQIIDCFDGKSTIGEIEGRLNNSGVNCTLNDITQFVEEVLVKNAILEGMDNDVKKENTGVLWFYKPIIDSNKLLWLFKILNVFYHRIISKLILLTVFLCAGISVFAVVNNGIKQTDVNSIGLILFTYTSMILHELGHATAAYRKKTRVGFIGIGLYLLNPVFYVDLTNIWRLGSKDRVFIDSGGMFFQLIPTIPLTIFALLSGNQFYHVISLSIVMVTALNLIPFIKLDGYWVLCDYLGLDNMSKNAFGIVFGTLKGIFKKGGNSNMSRLRKVYIAGAFVYTFSTLLVMSVSLIFITQVSLNFNVIIDSLLRLFYYIKASDASSALTLLNQIFLVVAPLLFLPVIIIINVTKIFRKNLKA